MKFQKGDLLTSRSYPTSIWIVADITRHSVFEINTGYVLRSIVYDGTPKQREMRLSISTVEGTYTKIG
jgi:hypothetical protein